jgi:predicted peptidase
MRFISLLFAVCFTISSSPSLAQKKNDGSAWMQTISSNIVMSPNKPGTFAMARQGFALYYSDAGNEKVPYLVYVPKGYDPTKATPVVVFLHGAILARDNYYHHTDPSIANEPVFSVGDAYNTLVVFPFAKSGFAWPAQEAANENVLKMIEQVKERYNVNSRKIVLGGISMGGSGTYWFINNKAENFAGFFTFSAIPHDLDFSKVKTRPLYSLYAKDDPGCPNNELTEYRNQHKVDGWYVSVVETGGHRFIYNPGGEQYVRSIVGMFLK